MDYYPTRSGVERIIDRFDCVSFMSPHSNYEREGFDIIPSYFKEDEIADLQDFAFADHSGRYQSLEPSSKGVRSLLGFHEELPWLSERLRLAATAILGPDFYIHQSRLNYKAGTSANGWKWHSDFETWHYSDGMPRMRCFTAMIPLQENTAFNGPLTFIAGSHWKYVSCAAAGEVVPESEFSDQTVGLPSDDAVSALSNSGRNYRQAICAPGDLVIFDCNTLHASTGPLDPMGRANLFIVFNALDNALAAPFGGKKRPIEMATRFSD